MLKKIFFIFDELKKFKNSHDIKLILLFTLIASFLEIFGLSAIGTFLSALSSDLNENNILLDTIKKLFSIESGNELFRIFGYIVIFSFILINILNAYIFSFITKRSNAYVSFLSTALFQKYLGKNYFFFTKENLPNLTKNIINETHTVINNIIFPIFLLISKVVTAVIIIIFLFLYSFKVTSLLLIILSTSYIAIYIFFKSKLSYLGIKIIFENARKYKIVQETLFGIKEIKLFNLKKITINNLKYSLDKFYKYKSLSTLITMLPRYLVEIVIVSIFIFFILLTFEDKTNNFSTISTLAVFVVASSRLFPAFQNIYSGISKINNSFPSFNLILNELSSTKYGDIDKRKNNKKNLKFEKYIILKNIYFKYPSSEKYIFENLNLKIKKNSIFGIKGKSGVGKSTLADLISGLIVPEKGKIIMDKTKLKSNNIISWRNKFSYVPQKVFLFDETIKNNIILGDKEKNNIKYDNLKLSLKFSQLETFVNSKRLKLDFLITGNGMNISGGQRQRIGVARCLYYDKEIIIFDEATAGLDKTTENNLLKTIMQLSNIKTIIIISHNKSIINNCDDFIDLDEQ
jgi:ABC-type multidrug transport system fused ATPase/permease subunit